MESARVDTEGGAPLWFRAVAQPWSSMKIKVTIGVLATKDARRVPDSNHPRHPFISLLSVTVPILPSPPEEDAVCLPFVPYIIDSREEDDEPRSIPKWKTIVKATNGLFRETSAPHSKSNLENLYEALKTDWKAPKKTKYIYPELISEEDDIEEVNIEGMYSIFSNIITG